MKTIWLMIVVGVLGTNAVTAEIFPQITVDGVVYRDVKFGAVNQGQVVMFHSKGVTSVPVGKLPTYARGQLESTIPVTPPPPPTKPAAPPALVASREERRPRPLLYVEDTELAAYHRAAAATVVFNGQLVDRSSLVELTGFLTKINVPGVADESAKWFIDVATKTGTAPKHLELRPSLWTRTGECVLLQGYVPDDLAQVSGLVRTYGREIPSYRGLRAFEVGNPPTFTQWKRLQNGNN
jgi:hypothetical protein